MKIIKLLAAVILASFFCIFSEENKIAFTDKDAVDLQELMDKNGAFYKKVRDIDVDDQNNIYLLDVRLYAVLRVDSKSGKLINTISSRGQGPKEISFPLKIRVRNGKVFILDGGFNGVKIFKVDGTFINEFRLNAWQPGWGSCFDVNKTGEILINEVKKNFPGSEGIPSIAVYDQKGNRKRYHLQFKPKVMDHRSFWYNNVFTFRLDNNDNCIVIFQLLSLLRKYNSKSKILWEKKIKNDLLDTYDNNPNTLLRMDPQGYPRVTTRIFSVDINDNSNIVIGHAKGGCIYNKNGQLLKIFEFLPNRKLYKYSIGTNFRITRYMNDKLVALIKIGLPNIVFTMDLKQKNRCVQTCKQ